MDKKIEKMKLSEAFDKLENITREFEKGEVDLEGGIAKFREGLELAKFLKKRLGELENEIEEIGKDIPKISQGDEQTEPPAPDLF